MHLFHKILKYCYCIICSVIIKVVKNVFCMIYFDNFELWPDHIQGNATECYILVNIMLYDMGVQLLIIIVMLNCFFLFSSFEAGIGYFLGNYALQISPNPLTAKLFNLNFHPLEIVSRWRDPQLQVGENYSDLTKRTSTVFKYCWLMSYFIYLTCLKGGT